MARSIAGTRWVCQDPENPYYKQPCMVIDGDVDRFQQGENRVTVRFEDGAELVMPYRRLTEQFDQPLHLFA